jgi:uncharacterized membrane protein YecN with MAPEG domain
MKLAIVPVYAAMPGLMFLALSVRVIGVRGRSKVLLGTGGVQELERWVRAHGNFAEYSPFSLLLLALAELHGAPALALQGGCLCLLAGRLLHAWGVSRPVEDLRFRGAGMGLTFAALAVGAVAVLVG